MVIITNICNIPHLKTEELEKLWSYKAQKGTETTISQAFQNACGKLITVCG